MQRIDREIRDRQLQSLVRRRRERQLIRVTKLGSPAAQQDQYAIKIHLQTNATGKHSIVFRQTMLRNPREVVPVEAVDALPRIPRKPGPPYARPIRKSHNKEWDQLSV